MPVLYATVRVVTDTDSPRRYVTRCALHARSVRTLHSLLLPVATCGYVQRIVIHAFTVRLDFPRCLRLRVTRCLRCLRCYLPRCSALPALPAVTQPFITCGSRSPAPFAICVLLVRLDLLRRYHYVCYRAVCRR